MAQNERRSGFGKFVMKDMDVRSTDPCPLYRNQYFIRLGPWILDLP
jgi:hypothetical protein